MSIKHEVNRSDEAFEQSLRSIAPTAANVDEAAVLREHARRTNLRRGQIWRTIAAAAAIVLAARGLWVTNKRIQERADQPPAAGAHSAPREAVAATVPLAEPPTLLAYRRALIQSPAALDDLLDAHAVAGLTRDPQFTPASAPHTSAALDSFLGAM